MACDILYISYIINYLNMNEVWKKIPIEGDEKEYFASNLWNFKSKDRISEKEKILKPYCTWNYFAIKIGIKHYYVHRLVMYAFEGVSTLEVNHMDWNKENNMLNNLEYCTTSENQLHSYRIWLRKAKRGIDNPLSKKVLQFNRNMELISTHYSLRETQIATWVDFRAISAVALWKRSYADWFIFKYE